jgi:hypothetical protein
VIRTRPENELSYYYWTLAEALVVTTTSTFRPVSFCRVGKVLYYVQHARHPLPSADRKLSPWAATWFGCIGCVQGHRCPRAIPNSHLLGSQDLHSVLHTRLPGTSLRSKSSISTFRIPLTHANAPSIRYCVEVSACLPYGIRDYGAAGII